MKTLFPTIPIFSLCLLLAIMANAQNPYAPLGVETEVLTLTEGKYPEFIPNKELVALGGVMLNTKTGEVVEFLEPDTVVYSLDPTTSTRFLSVDPIGKQYPELTPYQFASNRPIDGSDLDGLEWVLRIYSPRLSKSFLEAVDDGNIIEQRRITYYALNNKFVGDNGNLNNWASNRSSSYFNRGRNLAGALAYDAQAKEGLTVYLYGYFRNDQFTEDVTSRIDISDKIAFDFNEGSGAADKYFPVDVNLLNVDGSADGSDFYGTNDFQGYFAESSVLGNGSGVLSGRLRGYGYLDFSTNVQGLAGSFSLFSVGPLTGTYIGEDASPDNPLGSLTYFLGASKLNALTGDWWSTDSDGDIKWKGSASGVGVSFGADLGTILTSYTTLLQEYKQSQNQRSTISKQESKRTIDP